MKLGFTGTRKGMSANQKVLLYDLLSKPSVTEFIHGGAIGADSEANLIAAELKILTTIYPANNAPLERNKIIVNECDILIAAPIDPNKEQLRSGTWATIRYAKRINKPVVILGR